ncbi:MAG: hypothetical protein RBT44_05220 [Sphaerochaetaceae bacterium]|jgi:hypothetical protein|nr:hypothetical protein [Sphaerochaetaceae bacterium]
MKITTRTIDTMEFQQLNAPITTVFPGNTYESRIARAIKKGKQAGYSHLVIYGDREHFANIHYFTGFDPRFEEALLILSEGNKPLLLVGNEGLSYSRLIPFELDITLFQSFSLVGQPRSKDTSRVLGEAYKKVGIGTNSKVGVIGWKYFSDSEGTDATHIFDVPHFIVESLKTRTEGRNLENATKLLIGAEEGMRTDLDVDELAVLELAGTKTSRSVLNMLMNLRPGISEIEASTFLHIDGNPLVAHPNINFTAEGILQGLVSPGTHELEYGSVCNVGFGYRSSMVARTGLYTSRVEDIKKKEFQAVWDKVFVPYFKILVLWYESVAIGVSGRHVVEKIKKEVPEFEQLGIGLNPGHLIHNDEWTNSLFVSDKDIHLRSGMAIQCDIIANPEGLPGVHVEDGLALADVGLRAAFKNKYPEAWARIERRRQVMTDVLGFKISDDLLPFSDIQGMLFPWMADLRTVMAVDR